MKDSPPKVALIVFNHFSPFHLSVPCIVFSPDTLNETFFDLKLVAGEEGPLVSNVGMEIHTQAGLEELAEADIIIVPFWRGSNEKPSQALIDALVKAHQKGTTIIGLCLGSYILAYTGLLDGKKAATHWELEPDFVQRFPKIKLDTNALYIENDNLITSAGTAAGMDCCLHVFRKYYGSAVTNRLARRLVVAPHRDGGQAQFIERPVPENTSDSRINELLTLLRGDLKKHYSLDELSNSVMLTRRTFTRKFNKATGMSVGEWLSAERLNMAQNLLETTDLSIEQIAEEVGFSSVLTFRDKFKQKFYVTPKQWRKTFHER